MKSYKVISFRCLPVRAPTMFSAVVWLLLDRLDPAGWVHGMTWTFVLFLWFTFVIQLFRERREDVPGFGEGG